MNFKDFCERMRQPHRRELFLVKDVPAREALIIQMFNEAGEAGLCPILRSANGTMIFDQSIAMIRVAHQYIDRELAGTQWHAIHDIELVEKYENADEMRGRLGSYVRL
jgi:hypothetical protein